MRHVAAAVAAAFGVVLMLPACGGDPSDPCSKNPTAPSCPQTTVTINSSVDHLKVQGSFTFVAAARHPDSSIVTVTQWSSDATAVATVDAASGKVTAVSAGKATIIAEHDGARATQLLHAVPDFQGTWDGEYVVTSCTDTGDFDGWFCQEFPGNEGLPIALRMAQNANTDAVQAAVAYGEYLTTTAGTVDDNGMLPLTDATVKDEDLTIQVTSLKLGAQGTDRLTGTFRITWTYKDAAGHGEFDGQFRTVTRTSSSAVVAPMIMRQFPVRSLRDAVLRLKIR